MIVATLFLAGRIHILLYISGGSAGLFTIAWTSAAAAAAAAATPSTAASTATAAAAAGGKEQGLGKDKPHCHSVLKKRNI